MKFTPTVSVIFPVYNVESYVTRALESLLCQSYAQMEIIIVDDRGTDESMRIVRNLCRASNRTINIIQHEANKGLSAARNSGLAVAKGDYVYFMDSDDELAPLAIELLIQAALSQQADMSLGGVEAIGFDHKILVELTEKQEVLVGKEAVFTAFATGGLHVVAWNKLIKRAIIREHALFFKEGVVHEDLLWSFQLALSLEKIVVCPEKTYRYYANNQSITGTKKEKNFRSYNVIFDELRQIITGLNPQFKKIAFQYFEFQRYAVVESLIASSLKDQYKKEFFYLITEKRVVSVSTVLLSRVIDYKVKIKSLIMNCPYRLAIALMKILQRG